MMKLILIRTYLLHSFTELNFLMVVQLIQLGWYIFLLKWRAFYFRLVNETTNLDVELKSEFIPLHSPFFYGFVLPRSIIDGMWLSNKYFLFCILMDRKTKLSLHLIGWYTTKFTVSLDGAETFDFEKYRTLIFAFKAYICRNGKDQRKEKYD